MKIWSHLMTALALLTLANPAARADALDDITMRGTIRIAVPEGSPPFAFRDPAKGIVTGYDVDLANAVAERLRVKVEHLVVLNKERLPVLRDGRADLVAAGMTRSPERAKEIDFSLATLASPHKVMVRRDSGLKAIGDLADRTLALVASASVDADLMHAVPTLKIAHFDHYRACFEALRDRTVASFLADELLLLSFAQKSGAPKDYTLLDGYILPRTSGFGIKKGEPRLKAAIDRALVEIEASGEAARIYDTWFKPLPRNFTLVAD